MKRLFLALLVVINSLTLTGCTKKEEKTNETIEPNVVAATYNDDGDIIIEDKDITEEVTYISHDHEGTTIGLLAVRDENGKIHIVVDTCQSCGGSPYAYFLQVEDVIQCQNCGNTFLISELGNLIPDGCNPIGIENIEESDNTFIIDHEEIEEHKDKFENWDGPKL